MAHDYTPVFIQDGEWWVGYVPELPGALTQGRTLQEAQENMKEAIALILEVRGELDEHDVRLSASRKNEARLS